MSPPDIPLNDFRRLWAEAGQEVLAAVQAVGESGAYVLGPEVHRLEAALAPVLGRPHVIGCGSGLDAIEIALRALALPRGAKVLTTPLTAQTAWSPVPPGYPTTAAEDADFSRHTRHEEMWEYLEALRAVTPEMRLGVYGETRDGRQLPYAVFSRPLVSEPWEAWTLGRPVLVLDAH